MNQGDPFRALRLDGEVVIVTGAAGGIGSEIVHVLICRGAAVVATDRTIANVQAQGAVLQLSHDVSDESGWERVVELAQQQFGAPTALVNNAGVLSLGPILEFNAALAQSVFAINVTGVALGIKTVGRVMAEHRRGSIVNISSVAGVAGFENNSLYCASKWAVRGLSKAAALELGRLGVRVNTVLPGLIDTPMTRNPPNEWGLVRERARRHPLGRVGEPAAVAELVAYLLSSAGSYCTGAEITVDGGEATMVGAGASRPSPPAQDAEATSTAT